MGREAGQVKASISCPPRRVNHHVSRVEAASTSESSSQSLLSPLSAIAASSHTVSARIITGMEQELQSEKAIIPTVGVRVRIGEGQWKRGIHLGVEQRHRSRCEIELTTPVIRPV